MNFVLILCILFLRYELLVYILVGLIGGIFGCIWKKLTLLITKVRTFLSTDAKSYLLFEAVLFAVFAGYFHISLLYMFRSAPCIRMDQLNMKDIKPEEVTSPTDFFVEPSITCNSQDAMPQAGILLISPHHIIIFMIHSHPQTFSLLLLAVVLTFLCFQSMLVVGMCISTGIFVSQIVIGMLWGRILGEWMYGIVGEQWCDPSKFAMLGAAAQLSGVFHYWLVGVAVLIETTGSYQTFTVPLLITTVVARCMSHWINKENYYQMILKHQKMPIISHSIPWNAIKPVTSIMAQPAIFLPVIPTVGKIMELLTLNKGRYPVLNNKDVFLGDLSRYFLCAMLLNKMQDLNQPVKRSQYEFIFPKLCNISCTKEYYDKSMQKLRQVLTDSDLEKKIHLKVFVNQSYHEVPIHTNVAGLWAYFRQTGLHTLYVTQEGKVQGVVTRKDLLAHEYV